jgi:hypothetical protein
MSPSIHESANREYRHRIDRYLTEAIRAREESLLVDGDPTALAHLYAKRVNYERHYA